MFQFSLSHFSSHSTVDCSNLDGLNRETILNKGLEKPTGIAVHPLEKWVWQKSYFKQLIVSVPTFPVTQNLAFSFSFTRFLFFFEEIILDRHRCSTCGGKCIFGRERTHRHCKCWPCVTQWSGHRFHRGSSVLVRPPEGPDRDLCPGRVRPTGPIREPSRWGFLSFSLWRNQVSSIHTYTNM